MYVAVMMQMSGRGSFGGDEGQGGQGGGATQSSALGVTYLCGGKYNASYLHR